MVTSPSSKDNQEDLNKRLRSLKIDRGPAPSPAANNRSPKLLLLGVAVVLALAALGYVFLFSSTKTISAAADSSIVRSWSPMRKSMTSGR